MAHKHTVYDADPHFSIDPVTRSIQNKSGKVVIMQYDHNSECLTFDMPKTIDGHDMSLCNLVQVHYNNEGSSAKEEYSGVEEIKDFHVNPNNQDQMVFSWLISGNATLYAGTLSFSVSFQCTSNGDIDYEWGTDTYEELSIRKRPRNSDKVAHRMPDILTTWRNELFTTSNTEEGNILTVSQAQQNVIAKQGENILSRIVDTDIYNRAAAIVCEAEGETVVINDSSNDYVRGLKVFGKSTQDGTPIPDNPVEIVPIITTTVGVYGRNLCRESALDDMGTNGSSSTYDSITRTITMIADPTGFAGCYCAPFKSMLVGKEYTMSFSIRGTPGKIVKCGWDKQGVAITLTDTFVRYSVSITATKKNEPIVFYSRPAVNGGLLSGEYMQFADVQIEVGSVAHEYEPYAESQSFTLAHTLPGIPVTSGGNYTDSDGQQWVCDEIDFERGVRIQRTMEWEYDGSEDERWKKSVESYFYLIREQMQYRSKPNGVAMSTRFKFMKGTLSEPGLLTFGNAYGPMLRVTSDVVDEAGLREWIAEHPFSILYELETPIETPLTAEEITAFKALRTNYPNTTILNDAGAHMSVKYNADTKLYIDNKITSAIDVYLTEHLNG